MSKLIRKCRDGLGMILDLLTPPERRQLAVLSLLMATAGLMEVASVISVVPFLSVASRPEVVQENETLRWWYETLNFESTRSFLIFGGLAVVAVILLTNGLLALITFLQLRFSGRVNASVADRLFSGYLNQPYEYYLSRNSADMQACVQGEVVYVQSSIIQPLLHIIQKLISAALLLLAVVLADPMVALVGLMVCGGMYGLVFVFVRGRLKKHGESIGPANKKRFKALNEAFGTPKLTKVMNLESLFSESFAKHNDIVITAQMRQQMLGALPRYVLEGLAFSGIMVLAIVLIAKSDHFGKVIPVLGFYAFAGYRLMPAVQTVYTAIARLQFGWSRLISMHGEFMGLDRSASVPEAEGVDHLKRAAGTDAPLLELKDISFKYTEAASRTIDRQSLVIKENSTIGICGTTGAGKTTMLDLLLGLLKPESGELLIDGCRIDDQNRRAWQRQIGYVPQEIVLTDTSIEQNIAFGVPPEQINMEDVVRAAEMAGIAKFIETELPEKYETTVGERGERLSGGQRQRVGIARALYRKPRLLVFDEATSSLDTETERTVMSAIRDLSHQLTIVMVAHRINTLEPCDWIFRLEKGRIAEQGPFERLFPRHGQVEKKGSPVS